MLGLGIALAGFFIALGLSDIGKGLRRYAQAIEVVAGKRHPSDTTRP